MTVQACAFLSGLSPCKAVTCKSGSCKAGRVTAGCSQNLHSQRCTVLWLYCVSLHSFQLQLHNSAAPLPVVQDPPSECCCFSQISWLILLPTLSKALFSVIISTPVTPGKPDSRVDCAHWVSALPYTSQYTPEKKGASKTPVRVS